MRLIGKSIAGLIGAIWLTASAAAGDNPHQAATSPKNATPCAATKPHRPYTGHIPSNFVLIEPCPDAESDGATSNVEFVGEATVDGIVGYSRNEILGQYAYLAIDKKSKALLPEYAGGFRLSNSDLANFHLPALKDDSDDCLTVQVRVSIKAVGIVDEGGTDGDGPYLKKYAVLRIGNIKHHACKQE